jgi:hypothetical protein
LGNCLKLLVLLVVVDGQQQQHWRVTAQGVTSPVTQQDWASAPGQQLKHSCSLGGLSQGMGQQQQ